MIQSYIIKSGENDLHLDWVCFVTYKISSGLSNQSLTTLSYHFKYMWVKGVFDEFLRFYSNNNIVFDLTWSL